VDGAGRFSGGPGVFVCDCSRLAAGRGKWLIFLCAGAVSEALKDKGNPTPDGLGGLWGLIVLLPFFLIFIGDFYLPVGSGQVTIPMGMVVVFPVVFLYFFAGRVAFSAASLLLAGVLFCGFSGMLVTPEAGFLRSFAGALPIIFSVLVLIFYEIYPVSYEAVVRCMLAGGVVLAVAVVILFLVSLGVSGGYYEQKLVIETPLGRSNYLAAFLVFLFALGFSRGSLISLVFLAAIFCTLSRGGVLALAVFFVLHRFLKKDGFWIFAAGMVFVGVLVFFIAACGGWNFSGVSGFQGGGLDSIFNRLELWSFGLDIFSRNPVFGVGPNTFRTFVELDGGIEDVWGVHNSILLLLLNYGVFGFIFYSAYIFLIYRSILLAEKIDERFFCLRAAFLVLMIFGLYEPLVGSAAFEVLLAMIFILSRSRTRMPSS
jgi:O-antigen ligase